MSLRKLRGGRHEKPAYARGKDLQPCVLIEVEVADLWRVRRLFGLLHGLLELLLQQIGLVLLRVHRLAEDGLATAILVLQRPGRFIKIRERLRFDGRGMRDDRLGCGIHLQYGGAARARNFKSSCGFGHGSIINQFPVAGCQFPGCRLTAEFAETCWIAFPLAFARPAGNSSAVQPGTKDTVPGDRGTTPGCTHRVAESARGPGARETRCSRSRAPEGPCWDRA